MAETAFPTKPLFSLFADAIRRRAESITAAHESGELAHDELIHEIRISTKEFRAFLRLLRHPSSNAFCERESKRLQATARSLATDRDPLVVRETLEQLAEKCDHLAEQQSVHRILLHLGDQRPRARHASKIVPALTRLRRSAKSISRQFERSGPNDEPVATLASEYRRTRRITRKKHDDPGVKSWHQWRKQVKSFHYQANCLFAILPRKLRRLVRSSWDLQGLLGRHHDLHITRQHVRRLRVDPINEPCRRRTCSLIDRETRRLEKKVGKFARRALRLPPKEFKTKLQRACLE